MREDRAVLAGAGQPSYMAELGRLATTLGMEVAGVLEQGRRDGSGYLGRGKREELSALVAELGARFVVADDELSASQARVLERAAGTTVVDRTELIIRIFEAHARDSASRLEVELADLEYRLPRVKGRNPELSRLGGGGNITRGPGEQQLEYDRRAIRRRIQTINRKLAEEKAARVVRGARLRRAGPPTVALVGYTNAGKTTILNALSGAGRSTRDRLFETLETTTRLVSGTNAGVSDGASNGRSEAHPDFVVTDTVGFIRKLPTQLVHSFAATLEAARDAEVLVICADAGEDLLMFSEELASVVGTLDDAGIAVGDAVLCLNKADLLSDEELRALRKEYPNAVVISAKSSVEALVGAIHEKISAGYERAEILIPHEHYGEATRLYGHAEIHARTDTAEGLWMDVTLPKEAL